MRTYIPSRFMIVATAVVSIGISIAAGYLLHMEIATALRSAVDGTSASVASRATQDLRRPLIEVEATSNKLKLLVDRNDVVNSSNEVTRLQAIMRAQAYAAVHSSRYITVMEYYLLNIQSYNASCTCKAGSYKGCTQNPNGFFYGSIYLDDTDWITDSSTAPETSDSCPHGYFSWGLKKIYLGTRIEESGSHLPIGAKIRSHENGWHTREPYFYKGKPYIYSEFSLNHKPRWLDDYSFTASTRFNYSNWGPIIEEFQTADTSLIVLDSVKQQVFVHTLFDSPVISPKCYEGCSVMCPTNKDCLMHPNELGPTVAAALNASVPRLRGTFFTAHLPSTDFNFTVRMGFKFPWDTSFPTVYNVSASLEGGEYFLRLTHVCSTTSNTYELLWMRTVSSVNDKVYAALVKFIIACCVIFAVDMVIAVLEIVLIAQPLLSLAAANRFLETMDLDKAEAHMKSMYKPVMLKEVARVTDGMLMAIKGLREYKAFLPGAMSVDEAAATSYPVSNIPAPGLETGKAALVFTDIQGSTATWEACPEGMKEGLEVHNNVMRECLSEHNGYEVKTIGDAFMVAFEETIDAVSFSLSVQERLLEGAWPQELLRLERFAWDRNGPWCGLRVRIGVHFGEVDVQLNTLTGRYDYFGNTVNKAARMEGACVGGAVAVTEEVMEKIEFCDFEAVVIPMGEVRLRGVAASVYPSILLSDNLSFRAPYVRSQLYSEEDLVQPPVVSIPDTGGTGLTSSSASMGFLDMRLPDEWGAAETSLVVNDTLAKVMMCTERSHGVLISVQGSRVAVGWNTSRPCPTHIENSLSFVVTLHRFITSRAKLHIGLSNSEVKHGTVGVKKQKFVTVLGRCVDVAGSLCSLGVKDDVFCLYGSVAEELCAMDGVRFELHAEAAVTGLGLNVYEAHVEAASLRQNFQAIRESYAHGLA